MKVLCIAASNVEGARGGSASVKACELVGEILRDDLQLKAEVEVVHLLDYEMNSCRMCGQCLAAGECVRDDAFNAIYQRMQAADALFVVCPHYAPLPSKVMMLLEKLEEMTFLNQCTNPQYHFTLYGKPAGVIGHGGMPEEGEEGAAALAYYRRSLLDPLSMALRSVHMRVLGAGDEWPTGVPFGVKTIAQRPGSIFVDITHDWDGVRARILPLVKNVMAYAPQ